MFKTKKISLVSPCVATVAALMTPLLCSSVQAASVGLADVSIAGSGQADYVFSNDTTLATYNTIPGGAPVNFTYEQANIGGTLDPAVTGTQAAHLFLSTTTSTPAGAAGPFDFQPIDSGTIQILLDTPVNGKNNLLTVNFTAGGILAFDGSSTPAFSATDSLSPGESVTYSSDFLNISGSSAGNAFQFITSNANPPIGIDADGFLATFASEDLSSYTFDNANQQVSAPEPASLGFVGLSAMALLRRRR